MANDLQADLRELVARRKVLVIVGSGVSIGATRNAPAASWTGLLELGVARCRSVNPSLDVEWEKRLISEIKSGDLDDMLSAAEKISRKLQAPVGGEFHRWLRETVGALQVHEAAVLEALRNIQVPLATTNYDDLLECVTKLPAITWRDQAKVFRVLRGEDQAILHLHGHWDDPESVVLGIRSYEQVGQNSHAQAVVRALAMTQNLLFIGCGEGLDDPNFRPFLSWLREVNASTEGRHYRLALAKDVVELQKQHPPEERIFVLSYGERHDELAGFLRSLAAPSPAGISPCPMPPPTGGADNTGVPLPSPAILEYIRRLEAATSKLQLIGLGQGVQIELPIQQAYIPLNVVVARGLKDETQFHFDDKALRQAEHVEDSVLLCDIFKWAARFDSRHVLLLGDPGAGKTTGARQFCWHMLHEVDLPKALGLPAGTLPVFLRLRNLTPHHLARGLQAFITDSVAASALPAELANPGPELLARRGVLWVFDGLDEVVNEKARMHVCGWLQQALAERTEDFFLVTSRYQGYQGPVNLGPAFCQFHVRPLDSGQVAEFVDHLYRAVCRRLHGPGDATEEKAATLIGSLMELLQQPEYRIGRLRELPANPLMLTILCVVHHQDRNLPRRRADLYAKCVRVLVEHWRKEMRDLQLISAFDPEAAEGVLASVAWWLHAQENRTSQTIEELGPVATQALADLAPGAGLGRDGAEFIRRMRDESGILTMWNAGQCGFLHLTFQEYLAGLHAAREGLAEALVRHLRQSWWREVILVAVAIGSRDFAQKFFTELLRTEVLVTEGAFVDQCLDEARYAVLEPFLVALRENGAQPERQVSILRPWRQSTHPDLVAVCRELVRSAHPELSALAREILQRAGVEMERPAIQVVGAPLELRVDQHTGIAFLTIPAGEFDMGSNDGSSDERPVHRVRISRPFLLGKYPVTNQEYQRFLEAHPKTKPPEYWSTSQFNDPQQPVVGVSWEDAQVFCQWAGCRLPTEAEWEYACRAGSRAMYCFGDDEARLEEYAWYLKNSGGKTQPVGQKKPNAWGLHDVHGNVWEWCQDWYASYPKGPVADPTGPVKGSARVLRGGAFGIVPVFLRCGGRSYYGPGDRRRSIGFRVVCASGSAR
jgi:formylglycine-generating enzyme required for sulfatase activity